jgi:hypothetical protein
MKNIYLFASLMIALSTQTWAQTFDTIGMTNWSPLVNSYTEWEIGAFDSYRDPANPADFGWGNYDQSTHIIMGDSIYIIKTVNDNYKAVSIDQLASGVFTVSHSNLDGTGKVTRTLDRSPYSSKNFFQYSLDDDLAKDLEPASPDWDIVFTKYFISFGPGFWYPVTGLLTNRGVQTSKVSFSSGGSASLSDTLNFPFSSDISSVGYDWKSAGPSGIVIHDTLTYFVKDQNGNINELVFTDYSGSGLGNIYFTVNGNSDSITMNPGNVDQVYYSLENKMEISTNQDHDWDIALFAQSSFSSIPVRINELGGSELYVYPNKDINHWNSIGLSEEYTTNLVSVYPNPASDQINLALQTDINEDLNYTITDQSGRTVASGSIYINQGLSEYPISVSQLSKGVYMIYVDGSALKSFQKIIID